MENRFFSIPLQPSVKNVYCIRIKHWNISIAFDSHKYSGKLMRFDVISSFVTLIQRDRKFITFCSAINHVPWSFNLKWRLLLVLLYVSMSLDVSLLLWTWYIFSVFTSPPHLSTNNPQTLFSRLSLFCIYLDQNLWLYSGSLVW